MLHTSKYITLRKSTTVNMRLVLRLAVKDKRALIEARLNLIVLNKIEILTKFTPPWKVNIYKSKLILLDQTVKL